MENSLKQGTREVRGTGTCRHVCDDAAIPLNSKSFLRLDDNKKELFEYLAARVRSLRLPDSEVICMAALDVIGSTTKEGMAPCNHKKTDTHIFVQTKHASVNGMKRTLIRTVDTDVVILDVEELWIASEVGKHLHYLSIHKIASSLNTEQCEGLPSFHALTGCDTVSLFSGKGKKTAFQAWKCFTEATKLFRTI